MLRWTWQPMKPGVTVWLARSITRAQGGGGDGERWRSASAAAGRAPEVRGERRGHLGGGVGVVVGQGEAVKHLAVRRVRAS